MTKPFVNVMNALFSSTDEDFLLLNHLDLFESCPSMAMAVMHRGARLLTPIVSSSQSRWWNIGTLEDNMKDLPIACFLKGWLCFLRSFQIFSPKLAV